MRIVFTHQHVVVVTRANKQQQNMAHWTRNETKSLVSYWKEVMIEHNINEIPIVRNSFLYMEIADLMERNGYTNKTWKQCRTKIKGLVSRYRKVNNRIK